ncbi:MAG TPA: hypothetical protein VNK23_05585 [Candidatus Dormibacteraeota bacterium]|nr:hypothetical protein [Candidatus Dormibacteraeota bacterium]
MAKDLVADEKTRLERPTNTAGVRPSGPGFPAWVRWGAAAWLLFWLVTYWIVWGPQTFSYLCDISVIVTCIGLWTNNPLLISSQAVSSLIVDAMWALDAAFRAIAGRQIFGGTEYLFNPSHPLWIRLLSLYHVAWPVLLLWALHRAGYDRRGWKLQAGIVTVAFVAARFTPAAQNINFAYRLPVVNRPFGPAPLHVAVSILLMIFVVYWPTHCALRKIFPPPDA